MKIAIIAPGRDVTIWKETIEKENSEIKVQTYPDISTPEEIEMVMLWQHPHGILENYPNVKFISSMGAGVDHIMQDRSIPDHLPITRIKDEMLTFSMTNYVVMAVLNYQRRLAHFQDNKKNKIWDMTSPEVDIQIGVMGVGELGGDVIAKLSYLGFEVVGYGNSPKQNLDYPYYHGDDITAFLSQVNVVVCLLPLTPETEDFMNKDFFKNCQKGTYIINAARGKHMVEEDLLEALESGQVSGAFLDVYREEPLSENHTFWEHPLIMMTPHIASVTNPRAAAPQIAANCTRYMNGEPLENIIDRKKGY